MRFGLLSVVLVWAGPVWALDLPTNARLTLEEITENSAYFAPTGPFANGVIPARKIEGSVKRQAWQIPASGLTSVQVVKPLRAQLEAQGYRVVLDCPAARCGGFDFRFGTDVLPSPAFYVNLRNFHFVTLERGEAETPDTVVTLMASTTQSAAYFQLIEARVSGEFATRTTTDAPEISSPSDVPPAQDETASEGSAPDLLRDGHIVLEGVDFASGSTSLTDEEIPALTALAAFLKDDPTLRIALVGHTDSTGSIGGNIRVSKQRAEAVRAVLLERYAINPARVDAEGMGYLAPRASNLTSEGRTANRRVEAILLSAE